MGYFLIVKQAFLLKITIITIIMVIINNLLLNSRLIVLRLHQTIIILATKKLNYNMGINFIIVADNAMIEVGIIINIIIMEVSIIIQRFEDESKSFEINY